MVLCFLLYFFFFQAEDGIRDPLVTGVQTCALPILPQISTVSAASREETVEICGSTIGPVSLVIPSRKIQDRNMHAVIFAAEFGPVPPGIPRRMREPFVIEGRDVLHVGKFTKGKKLLQSLMFFLPRSSRFFVRSWAGKILPAANIRCDIEPDPVDPGPVECAAGIEEIARRGESHCRNHGF